MIGLEVSVRFSTMPPMNAINYLRTVTKTKSIGTRAVLNKFIAIAIVEYS